MAVGVNLYFNIDYLKSAIDVAKCCIAKKQAAQVSREANFMGRCADIENEISFLQSSLILLENYTYLGDYNQITESEALELIERVHNLCNCGEQEIYDTPEVCELDEICISGSVQEGESIPLNVPQQTTYPDLQCNYVFSIVDPTEGALNYVLSKNDSNVWELIDSNFDVLDTNSSVTGSYTFSVGDNSYTINVSTGACPPITCTNICVGGSYSEEGGDPVNLVKQNSAPSIVNGACYYTFSLFVPRVGTVIIALTKVGSQWIMSYSGGVLDTNPTLNGNYTFDIPTTTLPVSYNINVALGDCE